MEREVSRCFLASFDLSVDGLDGMEVGIDKRMLGLVMDGRVWNWIK